MNDNTWRMAQSSFILQTVDKYRTIRRRHSASKKIPRNHSAKIYPKGNLFVSSNFEKKGQNAVIRKRGASDTLKN